MATVYSYIRFSDSKQGQGDSVRRQLTDGQAWLAKHPEHTIDTSLRMRDLGKSAFHGVNLDKDQGDLGKFVALVKKKNSPIKPGSILMLENIDRFSRQPAMKVAGIFNELVEAGIKILTLDPEEITDSTTINDMGRTLSLVLRMQLAHEESRKKSERNLKWWEGMREKAAQGLRFNKRCPEWLEWDKEQKRYRVIAGAAKAIRFMFKKAANGMGDKKVLLELQTNNIAPFSRSGHWNSSYVGRILRDQAVLGVWQPGSWKGGKFSPIGEPVPGFFPRVVDDGLFYKAQAGRNHRFKNRGPSGNFVNLFTGLLWNVNDGHPMHITTIQPNKKKIARRLVSYGHVRRLKGADKLSINYPTFERRVLEFLTEVKPEDILPEEENEAESELKKKEGELAGIAGRLAALQSKLEDGDSQIESILAAIRNLEKKREVSKQEIESLKSAAAAAGSTALSDAKFVLPMLDKATGEGRRVLRLRLRAALANLIDRILVEPCKHGHNVHAKVLICFKSGLVRHILYFPQQSGEISYGSILQMPEEPPYPDIQRPRRRND